MKFLFVYQAHYKYFHQQKKKNIDSNILILSHLITSNHLNSKNDLYFEI